MSPANLFLHTVNVITRLWTKWNMNLTDDFAIIVFRAQNLLNISTQLVSGS